MKKIKQEKIFKVIKTEDNKRSQVQDRPAEFSFRQDTMQIQPQIQSQSKEPYSYNALMDLLNYIDNTLNDKIWNTNTINLDDKSGSKLTQKTIQQQNHKPKMNFSYDINKWKKITITMDTSNIQQKKNIQSLTKGFLSQVPSNDIQELEANNKKLKEKNKELEEKNKKLDAILKNMCSIQNSQVHASGNSLNRIHGHQMTDNIKQIQQLKDNLFNNNNHLQQQGRLQEIPKVQQICMKSDSDIKNIEKEYGQPLYTTQSLNDNLPILQQVPNKDNTAKNNFKEKIQLIALLFNYSMRLFVNSNDLKKNEYMLQTKNSIIAIIASLSKKGYNYSEDQQVINLLKECLDTQQIQEQNQLVNNRQMSQHKPIPILNKRGFQQMSAANNNIIQQNISDKEQNENLNSSKRQKTEQPNGQWQIFARNPNNSQKGRKFLQ